MKRGLVISTIVLLAVPTTREFIFTWVFSIAGFLAGVVLWAIVLTSSRSNH